MHNKFLEGYVKILITVSSGWTGDGELEICEEEHLFLKQFLYCDFLEDLWTYCIHYIYNEKQLDF